MATSWELRANLKGPKGDPGDPANITEHEAATDPHSQYLTQPEADALYAPLSGGGEVGGGYRAGFVPANQGTTPVIQHDLDTADISVTVHDATNRIITPVAVETRDGTGTASDNHVRLTFNAAPTTEQYRYTILSAGPAPTGGGGSSTPDYGAGVFVPSGWGEHWYAKLAAAGTENAVVAVNGDSSSRYYASNLDTTSWTGRMRAALQTAHGDGGSGFKSVQDSSIFLNDLVGVYGSQFYSFTGTWINSGVGDGPSGHSIQTSTSGSTVTTTRRGTTIGVVYLTFGSGGTFNLIIDGGAPVLVNTNGANGSARYEVTGLAPGEHTVVIQQVNGFVNIHGVYGENDTGVIVNDFSIYGQLTGALMATSGYGHPANWTGGSQYPCDLLVVSITGNDTNANRAATEWAGNLRTYLQHLRDNAGWDFDLILMMSHLGTFDPNKIAHEYATQQRGLADHFGAAIVNFNARFKNSWASFNALGGWGDVTNPGASGTDGAHASDIGHQLYADAVIPLVLGGS